VAARSKAWVCGRSLAGIMVSNLAGGTSAPCNYCVFSGKCLCDGADHSSREVLLNAYVSEWVGSRNVMQEAQVQAHISRLALKKIYSTSSTIRLARSRMLVLHQFPAPVFKWIKLCNSTAPKSIIFPGTTDSSDAWYFSRNAGQKKFR